MMGLYVLRRGAGYWAEVVLWFSLQSRAQSSPSPIPPTVRNREPPNPESLPADYQSRSAGRRSHFKFRPPAATVLPPASSSTQLVAVFLTHLTSPPSRGRHSRVRWRRVRSGACLTSRSASTSARASSARSTSPARSRLVLVSFTLRLSQFPPNFAFDEANLRVAIIQSGYVVALKVTYKAKLEKYRFHAHLRREIEIQHGLDHPNVLRLFAWFQDEERVVLVLEYAARGELYKVLRAAGHFTERTAATVRTPCPLLFIHCYPQTFLHPVELDPL